ncbi:MAG: hypothetical protein ACOCSE_04585, partial [Chitinivibrionales bacterium]
SHELRKVTSPEFDTLAKKPDEILLQVRDLNTRDDDSEKFQMKGRMRVRWKPGSLCEDSTVKYYDFGNRFTPDQNGWIKFMPSFEGAISTSEGEWTEADSAKGLCQWIDTLPGSAPGEYHGLSGGLFYPNLNDSVTVSELLSGTYKVPYISMGIHIDSADASKDSSAEEEFTLWVLPGKENTEGNREFYWGVDRSVLRDGSGDPFIGSAGWVSPHPREWIQGPAVTLDSGNHTIDIYMRDDFTGIAGIALSKSDETPGFSVDELERWGDYGFRPKIRAEKLMDGQEFDFAYSIWDRFGNRGDSGSIVIETPEYQNELPYVTIEPSDVIEDNYFSTCSPGFDLEPEERLRDTVSLEVMLRRNLLDTVIDFSDRIDINRTGTEDNLWSVDIDSTNPLPEIQGSVCDTNSYQIYARLVNDNGDAGNWNSFMFGVDDTTTSFTSAELMDSVYEEPPYLKYRYIEGYEVGNGDIIGDLRVVFDEGVTPGGQELIIDNALIHTAHHTENGEMVYDSITGFDNGTFCVYEDKSYYAGRKVKSYFTINYGKYVIETATDSLRRESVNGSYRLIARTPRMVDDQESYARISSDMNTPMPVNITKHGIIDNFYSMQDYFFLKDVIKYSDHRNGFNIVGCVTEFSRNDYTEDIDTFSINAMGHCTNCGPYLDFTVLHPEYMKEEFNAMEKLNDPVEIEYTEEDTTYRIQWTGEEKNHVPNSGIGMVTYCGWDIVIESYYLDPNGVYLNNFKVYMPEQEFNIGGTDCDSAVPELTGIRIEGREGLNNSALHFYGESERLSQDVSVYESLRFRTYNDYILTKAPEYKFTPVNSNREYVIKVPEGGELHLPSWKDNNPFNERDSIKTYIKEPHQENLTLEYSGFKKINTLGDFHRTVGHGTEALMFDGEISVRYSADRMVLDVSPVEGDTSLISIKDGFFNDNIDGPIGINGSSLELFSDFSVNTMYGRKMAGDGKTWRVSPENTPSEFTIPFSGVEVVHTAKDSVLLFLMDPNIKISMLDDAANAAEVLELYNAAVTCDKSLAALNGNVKLPEEGLSLSDFPLFGKGGGDSFVKEYGDFTISELYFGYSDPKFTIGTRAVLEFGEIFKFMGMNGEKILFDEFEVSHHPEDNWKLERLRAEAFSQPRVFGISKSDLESGSGGDNLVEFYSGGNGLGVE